MERLPKILRYLILCGVIMAFQSDFVKGILQSDLLFEIVFGVVAVLLAVAVGWTLKIVKRERAEQKRDENNGLQGKGDDDETFND